MAIYLIIGLVFAVVFFLAFGVLYFISSRKDPVQLRLKAMAEEDGEQEETKKAPFSLKGAVDLLGL